MSPTGTISLLSSYLWKHCRRYFCQPAFGCKKTPEGAAQFGRHEIDNTRPTGQGKFLLCCRGEGLFFIDVVKRIEFLFWAGRLCKTWYKQFRREKILWQETRKYILLSYPSPSLLLKQNVFVVFVFFFSGTFINRLWRKPILKVYWYVYSVSLFLLKMFNRVPCKSFFAECPKHGSTHTVFIDLHFFSQITVGFLTFSSNRLYYCCLKHTV